MRNVFYLPEMYPKAIIPNTCTRAGNRVSNPTSCEWEFVWFIVSFMVSLNEGEFIAGIKSIFNTTTYQVSGAMC